MPFKLTIELSNRDLRHFQRELRRAREAVRIADDDEILSAAAELVESLRGAELPDFIGERLQKLQVLQAMLTDTDWPLTDAERSPVLAALAYVCDPVAGKQGKRRRVAAMEGGSLPGSPINPQNEAGLIIGCIGVPVIPSGTLLH